VENTVGRDTGPLAGLVPGLALAHPLHFGRVDTSGCYHFDVFLRECDPSPSQVHNR
jgi:hypothetical protein